MSMKYADDEIPICVRCDKLDELKVCKKCHVQYCKHFSAVIDTNFCANCIGDVQLIETVIEKTVEHERPDGTISFSRKSQARRLRLVGNDWLFLSHLIGDMSDAEIEASVEYHRANVDLMLQERESRKQERYRKLANIKIVHNPGESQEQRERRESKANRKSKVKEKDQGQALLDALTMLAKSGMSQKQIMDLLGGKK